MLAKRIIPCLDVKDGVVVKGVKFRGHEVVGDIVPLARRYAQEFPGTCRSRAHYALGRTLRRAVRGGGDRLLERSVDRHLLGESIHRGRKTYPRHGAPDA